MRSTTSRGRLGIRPAWTLAVTGPRLTMGWGSVGFPTIHAIDKVCDLEINIENLSELLDSGIRTEFTHITIIQHAVKRVPRKCQARNRPVSPINFPPDLVMSSSLGTHSVLCVRSTWRLPGVSSYDRGGLTITWIHRRGSSPTQVLRKARAVNWSPHEANL